MSLSTTLLIVIVAITVFLIVIYNSLVSGRNYVRDAWSGVDVQLKKRHDLIPALVNIVKAYCNHEKELLTKVVELRTPTRTPDSIKTGLAENTFGAELNQLLMLAEAYPSIKADQNFQQLQSQLFEVESDIESARRYYNGSVRDLNIKVESFPSNLVANQFGFKVEPFFEITLPSVRNVPTVKL